MKHTLKYLAPIIALLFANNLAAQEKNDNGTFEKYNWFVSGALNGEWLFQTVGNTYVGGKVGGGIYFNRFSGVRAQLFAGRNRIDSKDSEQYGVGVDYMIRLWGNQGFRPFNLSATLGASYSHYNVEKLDITSNSVQAIGGTLALQASYNINRKLSFFIEPSLSVFPKYYDKDGINDMHLQSALTLGVNYSFKDLYRARPSVEKANGQLLDNEDVEDIKGKINTLLQEMEELKKESQIRLKQQQEKNLILEPKQKETTTIDLYFDEFDTFISPEQAAKVEGIGQWMKDNAGNIKIVAFSNDMKNKDGEEQLRHKRTEAIKKLLMEKYHIAPLRITVATPEAMGYENKTGSNALVIYTP